MQYKATMMYDDDTILKLFRTEYFAYETTHRVVRFITGMAGVLAAVFIGLNLAARIVFLMAGVWLLVANDFPSKIRAQAVIEKRGGKKSSVKYVFDQKGITVDGKMKIKYQNIDKLIFDADYYYFFVGKNNAVMFKKSSLKPSDEASFQKKCEELCGKTFQTVGKNVFSYNLQDLLDSIGRRKKEKGNSGRNK